MFFEGEISVIGIHNGKFHADEVMACAITSLLFENTKIIRSRNEVELKEADIIFDVGENDMVKVFNHHDRNWDQFRSNGIPFASAGAAWQMFGVEILKQMGVENEIHVEIFNRIDTIMAEIDAIDVGMKIDMKYGISPIISSFVPVNGTNDEIEAAFNEALNFAKLYIIREIKAFQYLELSKFQAWEVLKANVVTPPSSEVRASPIWNPLRGSSSRNPSELRGPCKSISRKAASVKASEASFLPASRKKGASCP